MTRKELHNINARKKARELFWRYQDQYTILLNLTKTGDARTPNWWRTKEYVRYLKREHVRHEI